MIYLSSQLAEVNPIMFNPFEDFETPRSLSGPCRTIKVTEEVRRLDQAARDEKLPADWLKFRATLSESNLRMARQERAGEPPPRSALREAYTALRKKLRMWEASQATQPKASAAWSVCVSIARRTVSRQRGPIEFPACCAPDFYEQDVRVCAMCARTRTGAQGDGLRRALDRVFTNFPYGGIMGISCKHRRLPEANRQRS